MKCSKEVAAQAALQQIEKDVTNLLAPFVTKLMETPDHSYDRTPANLPSGHRIKTLFLHETKNVAPDVDIFKLDLGITPTRLGDTLITLSVLERTASDEPSNHAKLQFILSKDGTLHYKRLNRERGRKIDPFKLLGDVKISLAALPTIPYGRI